MKVVQSVGVDIHQRLSLGAHTLMLFDIDRLRRGDPNYQRGVETAIVRRELAELAADCRRDPPRGLVTR